MIHAGAIKQITFNTVLITNPEERLYTEDLTTAMEFWDGAEWKQLDYIIRTLLHMKYRNDKNSN
jgi:hypothetical protein